MKMKVRLAAEVLSSSVADALSYLRNIDHRFRDVDATVEFIRQVCRYKHGIIVIFKQVILQQILYQLTFFSAANFYFNTRL